MEVMEQEMFASKGKGNAALTLGIIGTALSGLLSFKDGIFKGMIHLYVHHTQDLNDVVLWFASLFNWDEYLGT